jgi:hypothetical protein
MRHGPARRSIRPPAYRRAVDANTGYGLALAGVIGVILWTTARRGR